MLLYHVLEDHAANPKIASNTFLVFPADGRTWTYAEFFENVNRVGNWLLHELQVEPGELVALDGPNSPEYLVAQLAIDSIGACPCFVNYNLTSRPLEHCLKVCIPDHAISIPLNVLIFPLLDH
jgi:acyl-CoA synthetase (AMP-forming)/AMP-acid ligase II